MKETETNEVFFYKILSKSKLDVPFPDFDDNLMEIIKERNSKKTSISKDLKFSWMFFIIGIVFGISITIIIPSLDLTIFGIQLENLRLPCQIIFSFLLTLQIDNIFDYYRTQNEQTKR